MFILTPIKKKMGGQQSYQFSTVTQTTFDKKKYEGMWYKVFVSGYSEGCDKTIEFYFLTGETLNMTSYCVKRNRLVNHRQAIAVAPNKYDPCKLVLQEEGLSYGSKNYWIYYTDYTNFALVGDGKLNEEKNGSNYFVLSRSPVIADSLQDRIQKEIAKHAI